MDKQEHSAFIGIDVARDHLDVHVLPGKEAFIVTRDEKGLSILIARIREYDAPLVCLEATGGYEMDVVAALGAVGIAVVVMNPRRVRDYAKATGQLAKTDRLDAEVIADFAETIRPRIRPLPNDEERRFSALSRRRRQVTTMMATEKKRIKQAPKTGLTRSIPDHNRQS